MALHMTVLPDFTLSEIAASDKYLANGEQRAESCAEFQSILLRF
jgi:hypothetical protein